MINPIRKRLAVMLAGGSLLAGAIAAVGLPAAQALDPTCATATNSSHAAAGRAYNYGYFITTGGEYLGYNGSATTTLIKGLNSWDSAYWYIDTNNLCAAVTHNPSLTNVAVSVSGSAATVTGVATDPDGDLAQVVVRLGTNSPVNVAPNSSGAWSTTLSGLANGTYTITVKAVDAAGNESSTDTRNFTIGGPACTPLTSAQRTALTTTAIAWIQSNAAGLDSYTMTYCGETIADQYFRGAANVQHELQSATKTITSLGIGALIQAKPQLFNQADPYQTKLKDLLPSSYASLFTNNGSVNKADITLENVLTMSSGLSWNDGINTTTGKSDFEEMDGATDSVSYILTRPSRATKQKPRGQFFYNTGNAHLLSAVIHYNTGGTVGSTQKFIQDKILTPLGISNFKWSVHREEANYGNRTLGDGINEGGRQSYFTPGDFHKLGLLVLNKGTWNGAQLVPADYVKRMTTKHVQQLYARGFPADSTVPATTPSWYGYQMWIEDQSEYGLDDLPAFRGWGNQDTFICKNNNFVLTITGNVPDASPNFTAVQNFMKNVVAPQFSNKTCGVVE